MRTEQIKGTWQDPQAGSVLLGSMAFVALLLCVINFALSELQIVFTGRVPVPQSIVKIALFSLLLMVMLLYRKVDLSDFPTGAWLAVVGYLIFEFAFLWFGQGQKPGDIFLSYNAGYSPYIFAPIALASRGRVPEKLAMRILLFAFAACAILGWAQFLTQKPIIPLASGDGEFSLGAAYMQGAFRIQSFFANAQEYGAFLVVIAAIAVGMCIYPGGWKKGIPIYVLAVAACYTTLTRAVFLQVGVATFVALIFVYGRRPKRNRWMPLIALALGAVFAFGGIIALIRDPNGGEGIRSDVTLQARVGQWTFYAAKFTRASLWQQLFGSGIWQAKRSATRDAIADNLYWGLVLHIGLIGLLLVSVLFWAIWKRVWAEAIERPTPLAIGIASFWATAGMAGLFNNILALYGLWYLMGAVAATHAGRGDQNSEWAGQLEPSLLRCSQVESTGLRISPQAGVDVLRPMNAHKLGVIQ